MKSFEYVITDPVGIHARPAGQLVAEVKKRASQVSIIRGEKSVSVLRLMALLGMAPNPDPANNRELLLDCVEGLFLDI